MTLRVPSPQGQETAYRLHLQSYAQKVLNRLVDNIDADVTDLELVAIAAFLGVSDGIEKYNRRKIIFNLTETFAEDVAEPLLKLIKDADVQDVLDVARVANIELIKDISAQQKEKLFKAIANPTPDVPLVDEVQGILKSSRSRAKLIARDQTSKINSRLSKIRYMNAGAEYYIWRTVGDERVREDHSAVNGQKYKYGETTGVDSGAEPGEDIQCRCEGEPVFEF